jgi:hypothetical protein
MIWCIFYCPFTWTFILWRQHTNTQTHNILHAVQNTVKLAHVAQLHFHIFKVSGLLSDHELGLHLSYVPMSHQPSGCLVLLLFLLNSGTLRRAAAENTSTLRVKVAGFLEQNKSTNHSDPWPGCGVSYILVEWRKGKGNPHCHMGTEL